MDKKHLNKVEGNKIRRAALIAMGFCPQCMNYNDAFPSTECNSCKDKKRMRFKYGSAKEKTNHHFNR